MSKDRRNFLRSSLLAAASLLASSTLFRELLGKAQLPQPDLVHDTMKGFLALVVPGPDPYSLAQGVATVEPGALNAGVTDLLIAALDESTPMIPHFSATVAAILNELAGAVNPNPSGSFISPFARLSFAEKVAVLAIMDGTDPLKPLAGVLPPFAVFLAYSEAGVFDPVRRTATGTPVGWVISDYEGIADGRNEFLGYYENRRSAQG
jgi:hypothetical protein